MLNEIILHIGTPKTGTTALQLALSQQRRELFRFGLFFPETSLLGERAQPVNLQDLTLYAANPERPSALRQFRQQARKDPLAYRTRIQNAIAALAGEATAQGCSRLLLSAEGLYSLLGTPAEIKQLKALLEPHTQSFRILVWLRRQDEYLLSRVSQAAKLGTVTIGEAGRIDALYCYASRLALWEDVFTGSPLHAIPYQRDTLADFHRLMDLPAGLLVQTDKKTNRSLSAEAVALMRYRELQCPAEAGISRDEALKTAWLRQLIHRIDPTRQGKRLTLDTVARHRLMACFAGENQALADRHNGGKPFFGLTDLGPQDTWTNLPPYATGDNLIPALNLPQLDAETVFAWFMEIVGHLTVTATTGMKR